MQRIMFPNLHGSLDHATEIKIYELTGEILLFSATSNAVWHVRNPNRTLTKTLYTTHMDLVDKVKNPMKCQYVILTRPLHRCHTEPEVHLEGKRTNILLII